MTQIVEILPSVNDKWTWLTRHLVSFTSGTLKMSKETRFKIWAWEELIMDWVLGNEP